MERGEEPHHSLRHTHTHKHLICVCPDSEEHERITPIASVYMASEGEMTHHAHVHRQSRFLQTVRSSKSRRKSSGDAVMSAVPVSNYTTGAERWWWWGGRP